MKLTKEWLSSVIKDNLDDLKKPVTIDYKKLEEEIEKWRKKND